MQKFFSRRGIDSTAAAIAENISAHSIQAAPVALAKAVTAVAIAKGTTASLSTLTLIKGALKIMAWTKLKTAIVIGAFAIVATSATTVVIKNAHRTPTIGFRGYGESSTGVVFANFITRIPESSSYIGLAKPDPSVVTNGSIVVCEETIPAVDTMLNLPVRQSSVAWHFTMSWWKVNNAANVASKDIKALLARKPDVVTELLIPPSVTAAKTLPQFTIAAEDLASPATVITNKNGSITVRITMSDSKREDYRKFGQNHQNQQIEIVAGSRVLMRLMVHKGLSAAGFGVDFASTDTNAQALADWLNKR
jgi:hypothetical protein